jgi:uncharacterized protein (DUF2141 family)
VRRVPAQARSKTNRKLDTNFLGIPAEQWGASNQVRPNLRAPRFDGTVFQASGEPKDIAPGVKVRK